MQLIGCRELGFSVLLALVSTVAQAQITTDGTMGPAGTLPGPDYQIGADLGRQVGGNLFHSFGQFSINTGESATFSGPNSVSNIIGRVTGGNESFIDGTLRSTIPGANLYLLNPAGVLFGEHARLDVPGSVHVSTADYLRLSDGGRFDARTPANSVLTVAPVAAFGFLGGTPGRITIEGAFLQVPEGQTLSLIGGDLTLTNATLYAPAGRINVAAVASAGEVIPTDTDLTLQGFGALGTFTLEQTTAQRLRVDRGDPFGEVELGNLDVSGNGGGAIFIRGGQFSVQNGRIFADTYGAEPGRGMSIQVDRLALRGGSLIRANTLGVGSAGSIRVTAPVVEMRDGSSIKSDTAHTGAAGAIELEVDRLLLGEGSSLTSATTGSGPGGTLTITAREAVTLTGGSSLFTNSMAGATGAAGRIRVTAPVVEVLGGSGIFSDTYGSGAAGAIELQVDRLLVSGWSKVSSSTFGSGDGGPITVTAREAVILTEHSDLKASSLEGATGAAGRIRVTAPLVAVRDESAIQSDTAHTGAAGAIELQVDRLLLDTGGKLATTTSGSGDGGSITVTAREAVTLARGSGLFASSLAGATGAAGRIRVTAPIIALRDKSHIRSDTAHTGAAGAIELEVDRLLLGEGSSLTSTTSGSGPGGTLTVTAREAVTLTGGSSLRANADGANGSAGQILVTAPVVEVRDGSGIFSDTYGSGAGGTIELQVDRLLVSGGSNIATVTFGSGPGGDIKITASDTVLLTGGSRLRASSLERATGSAGRIRVTAPIVALRDKSDIRSDTAHTGAAGAIELEVDRLLLGEGSSLTSTTSGSGPGGTLTVTAREAVTLTGGSSLRANADGANGPAGQIRVTAPVVEVRDGSGIFSDTYGSGAAGTIELQVDRLLVSGGSNIATATFGSGRGGDIKITASDTVLLTGNDGRLPSRITVRSNTPATGRAGDITLTAQRLILDSGTTINAASDRASGGNIDITARDLRLHEGSDITTSVFGDLNTVGGNVTLNADRAVILNGGKITAKATQGKGGRITVNADVFLHEAAQAVPEVLDASSEVLGNDGEVVLNAPKLDLADKLVELPINYLTRGLNRRCVIGIEKGKRSSLWIKKRGTRESRTEGPLPLNSRGCSQSPSDESVISSAASSTAVSEIRFGDQ